MVHYYSHLQKENRAQEILSALPRAVHRICGRAGSRALISLPSATSQAQAKVLSHKPISPPNFLTKTPTTGGFTVILYRMNMAPTCYLTGRLQLAKKPSMTTFKLQCQPAAPEDH